ncbi:unnamed protein product [Caenorhabditis auriculariae]|uniref:Aminopeptidase n=1 Tax=Caenorhabditis auriculariae TaxID=2777116 RepID=A0A8S1HLT8_9PELO|nr:unnamed protein product [Caenorhabditis auriculariae]
MSHPLPSFDYYPKRFMGTTPQKPQAQCSKKSLFVAILAILFSVIITCIITYYITLNMTRAIGTGRTGDSTYTPDGGEETGSGEQPEAGEKPETEEPTDPTSDIPAEELRLPRSVLPVHYDLTIKTNIPGYPGVPEDKKLSYDGQVKMRLKVKERVSKITLNSVGLNFTTAECSVTSKGKNIPISSIENAVKLEMIYINLGEQLEENQEAELKLVFSGNYREDLAGLYYTVYTEHGEMKYAITTQMEPSDARKMVPCYDEPDIKANWTVTIIHPTGTKAISNGIEQGESKVDKNFISTKFKTTPKMSSYLLALFVSEFDYVEKKTKNGVRFRIYARPEAKHQLQYALNAGVKCTEYYEEYYGIKFPLEKQDMVAIPDFAAGAMENWGLITYRETALLYDENIYTPGSKRRVAVVIAHELAHQWFGNLVTMKWWDDLWLNEGFATLVEYSGTDVISDGNFRMTEDFVNGALSEALSYDSRASTHPLSFKITKVVEVNEAFDTISYAKGGSVLRMLRQVIGEKNFQKGLQHYLNLHKYSNAKAADLFEALNEKTPESIIGPNGGKLDVINFAEQWTTQLGYPLLTVTREDENTIKVTQERFKKNKDAVEKPKYRNPKYGFKWDVPVWYQEAGNKEIKFAWLKRDEPLFLKTKSAVVLNADSFGFYRVNYENAEWKKIGALLVKDHEKFSAKTRVRLIEDIFICAQVDLVDYELAIDFIQYISKEKEYYPWSTALSEIGVIIGKYESDPEVEPIKKYLVKLLSKNYAASSFDYMAKNYKNDKKFFDVLLMSEVLSAECSLGDEDCVKKATALYTDHVEPNCKGSDKKSSSCNKLAAPLRGYAYCYGVKKGGIKAFNRVFQWYRIEDVQREKDNLLRGMACLDDIPTLKKVLLNAMDDEKSDFRLQDLSSVFATVGGNKLSSEFFLNFLITRWDDLQVRLKKDMTGFRRIIQTLTSSIDTPSELSQLKSFLKATPSAEKMSVFHGILEGAPVKIAWRQKNLKKLSNHFAQLLQKSQ